MSQDESLEEAQAFVKIRESIKAIADYDLEELREMQLSQDNPKLMYLIGEAIGSLNNLLEALSDATDSSDALSEEIIEEVDKRIAQIEKDALDVEKILSECKTVKTLRNLRYNEKFGLDIKVVTSHGRDYNLFDEFLDESEEIVNVYINSYGTYLQSLRYNVRYEELKFDIYDKDINPDYICLDNCSCSGFDVMYKELYNEHLNKAKEETT